MDCRAARWGQVAVAVGQHKFPQEIVSVWLIGEAFEHDDEREFVIIDRHYERGVVQARPINDFFFFFGKPAFMSA